MAPQDTIIQDTIVEATARPDVSKSGLGVSATKPWLKFYDEGVAATLAFEEICVPDMLARTAGRFPNTMALTFEGYRVSFGELNAMVDRFAAALAGFGVKKGDPVALLLPNVIPCVVAYQAILRLGGIAVMNNPLYSDRELEHQFNDSGARVLVTLDLLVKRMVALRPRTPIGQIVYTSIGDYLPFPKNVLFPLVGRWKKLAARVKPTSEVYRWKTLLAQAPPQAPPVSLGFDDVAMYQYTAGTTGPSKGVVLSHGNLSTQVQQLRAWFPSLRDGEQVMLAALPLFHVFGLTTVMNFPISCGWGSILVAKPQPQQLLHAIRRYRPTFAPLVPTMYLGMLEHEGLKNTDMTCFNGFFSGSAPLPVEVIKRFEEMTGAAIVEGFGLTEASPVTHGNPMNGQRKPGSVGVPLPSTEARIVDLENGESEVSVGERGELAVKGPQVMQGYKGLEAETAATLRNGWLYTGDIATMDEEGYFYIVDRKKDIIISGGYNICPRDVEEVLYMNPNVQEACVVGIPHPKWGEAVKAFVTLKVHRQTTPAEIREFCLDKLAKYKLPAEVEIRAELPKSTIGKILRRDLRGQENAGRATGRTTAVREE